MAPGLLEMLVKILQIDPIVVVFKDNYIFSHWSLAILILRFSSYAKIYIVFMVLTYKYPMRIARRFF